MLQTGSLIDQLSVRELVTLTASRYPVPLAVDDVLAVTGLADIADQRTEKLSGGQAQRVRFANAIVTGRERDVLVAARDGATVADIATLFLSEGTVRNYLSSAISKAGARNRLEAIKAAESRGWL